MAAPEVGRQALAIGILVDDGPSPLWVNRLVPRLQAWSGGEVRLVILAKRPTPFPGNIHATTPGNNLEKRLMAWYGQIDGWYARHRYRDQEQFNLSEPVWTTMGVPVVRLQDGPGTISNPASAEPSHRQSSPVDLLIRCCPGPTPPGMASFARFGVWSWQGGIFPGDPVEDWSLWRQVIQGVGVCRLALVDETASSPTPKVLAEAFIAASPISRHRTRNRLARRAADLLLGTLYRIDNLAATGLVFSPGSSLPDPIEAPGLPPDEQVGGRLAWWNILFRLAQRAKREWLFRNGQWFLSWRRIGTTGELGREIRLEPPAGEFYADPFLLPDADGHHLFFEVYEESRRRGSIAWSHLGRDGTPGAVQIVLTADCHLSHPQVFAWNGQYWMLPETSERRTVELYRANPFPRVWVREQLLLTDILAVDAVIHCQDGLWWLFFASGEEPDALAEALYLYLAESPLGPWQPHPGNPIKMDVRSARPAGRLFWRDGHLWRPAQDCSRSYGGGVRLCRVDRLTPDEYAETEMERLDPPHGWDGLHSLEMGDGIRMVDGRRLTMGWWMVWP